MGLPIVTKKIMESTHISEAKSKEKYQKSGGGVGGGVGVVNDLVVAILVVTDHIIFSCVNKC